MSRDGRAPSTARRSWLRAGFAVLGVGVLLFNVLLMLSDRAPGALRRVGGDFVRRLFARIDASERAADVLADPRLPESDAIVHVAVWALAVALVGLAVWTWRGLLVGAVAVFAVSLAGRSRPGPVVGHPGRRGQRRARQRRRRRARHDRRRRLLPHVQRAGSLFRLASAWLPGSEPG